MLIILMVFAMIVMTKQTKINNGESRRSYRMRVAEKKSDSPISYIATNPTKLFGRLMIKYK